MFRIVCVLFILFLPLGSYGKENAGQGTSGSLLRSLPMLASDEPNVLGWTRDSYERSGFMDFTLSMRYPLLFDTLEQGYKFDMLPFMSFTGRMAQYSGQIRHSSPVVVKRFNPKLFMRFYEARTADKALWSDDNGLDYYDIGYAHESNGQYVDTPALFNSTAVSVGGVDIAQDYISRGWDYLGYKRHLFLQRFGLHSLDVELKYFLGYGLLQKGSEEYFAWETARPITRISQVDGLRLRLNFDFRRNWFKGASMYYTTGYRNVARWNTVKMEFGFTPLSDYLGLPIVLWGQIGYNNNIAQYYRHAWAVGLAASFETFK
ncbi:MAG: hypothetical protein ABI479_08945 [Gallionella sp.]